MKKFPKFGSRRGKGHILAITAISLTGLLGVAGLALDAGRAYGVRAKLYAAVDAASLGAAKAIADGQGAATIAAQKFFDANIPQGYIDSSPQLTSISFSTNAAGDVTIDVQADANLPTTFLQVIGKNDLDVGTRAQTVRRAVDLSFVVDNTTSLRFGSIGDVTQDVVDRSKDFVGRFQENFDRVALVKYAFGAEVPVVMGAGRGFDKALMETEIRRVRVRWQRFTVAVHECF